MEKLVLIDGNSLINRAFYAMPVLSTKDGTFTNAVYGFMNMFIKMTTEIKPTYVAVAFDLKAPTFRHKLYSEYKGTRKPMPEELRPQIPLLKEVLKLMNVAVIEKEGVEADDIIGTIAKHTSIMTYIFTGDKDSFQLVDKETEVHFTKRGITDVEIYTNDNFFEKTGLKPAQIIDLKALMGDASDNIPGVSGIGEKTAHTLLEEYSTIDGVYANLGALKGKLKEKIESGKESCYLSKTLATINTDCGVDTNVDKMRFTFPFDQKVKEKFSALEFRSLASRTDIFAQVGDKETSAEMETPKIIQKVKVTDLSLLQSIANKTIAIVYTKSEYNVSDGETEWVIPVAQTLLDDGYAESQILSAILPVIKNAKKVVLYSKKEFRHKLLGSNLPTEIDGADDLSIIKYLVDYVGKAQTLEEVLLDYSLDQTTPSAQTLSLYNQFLVKLKEQDLERLYYDVELPLADLLFEMETRGFKVDINALEETGEKYSQTLLDLTKEIRALAGEETLNVNSPKQLGELLFEKLKVGKGKKTKTGYSTSAEVLEALEDAHPIIAPILKYRKLQKLVSTYIDGFKPLIDRNTGLIKTSFNQTMTSTGRLSSKEPNLQNIPVRDEEGGKLRKFFVASAPDRTLVSADYSQIELRLMADFSGEKSLISAFNDERDIHTETASKVFGVPKEGVTADMRRMAKAVNFGIIYGISEYGLAKQLKISPASAREYISSYFATYPKVKEYMNSCVEFARKNGYAITVCGRRRYIAEINSSNFALRQFGERAAMNMPLQGSSADIIKLAMLKVDKRLKEEGLNSRLILQVHDELIIDTLKTEKERVMALLKEEMEGAIELSVPLTAEAKEGERWFDAK